MRILYANARAGWVAEIIEWMKNLEPVELMPVTENLITDIFFTDNEVDLIFIGEDLESDINSPNYPEELQEQLKKLENSKFPPITLGEVCRELCKKRGKKEPVIAMAIGLEPYGEKKSEIKRMIEESNMEYVDFVSNDIIKEFWRVIEKGRKK